jgi:hypothetical protein
MNCRRPDGLDVYCRHCTRERMRSKRRRYLASGRCAECGQPRADSSSIRYCRRCTERYAGRSTSYSRDLRMQVLRAYSNESPRCACCDEPNLLFLTLDHIENGGRVHRRNQGTQGVFRELKRGGFPVGFRVLCFNCNLARGFYGHCPHEGLAPTPIVCVEPTRYVSATEDTKRCTRCAANLPWADFYPDKSTPSGLQSRCRLCTREAGVARLRAARIQALLHYGAGDVRCACCGEREEKFLALDHINGDGPRQPGVRRGGNTFYAWLIKQGFPTGLRLLCHNCNCAKGRNRECPHVATSAV